MCVGIWTDRRSGLPYHAEIVIEATRGPSGPVRLPTAHLDGPGRALSDAGHLFSAGTCHGGDGPPEAHQLGCWAVDGRLRGHRVDLAVRSTCDDVCLERLGCGRPARCCPVVRGAGPSATSRSTRRTPRRRCHPPVDREQLGSDSGVDGPRGGAGRHARELSDSRALRRGRVCRSGARGFALRHGRPPGQGRSRRGSLGLSRACRGRRPAADG